MKTTIIADSSYLQGYQWASKHPNKVCPHIKSYQQLDSAPRHLQEFAAGVLAWYDEYTSQFIKEVRVL